ncbi:MAG: SDR family NAD(P)-dependent oxidoreductase, partial [Opitutales bacterium]
MNDSCFFVTGAAGFVGRQLCRRLRAAGHRVRGLVRRGDSDLEAIGVEVVRGDLAAPVEWQDSLAGVDYVIHCAARAAYGRGREYEAANVTGTHHVLAAARRAGGGLRRFVFVSTIGAVDRGAGDDCAAPLDGRSPSHPSSDYGRSKGEAEQLVRASGLPFSIVRPALVVGGAMRPDSHFAVFVRAALRGSLLARFAWPGRFSVVHVDDLAAALELCATHPAAAGRTFFCAGAPVALGDCFAQACPGRWRMSMSWAAQAARQWPRLVPFRMKALLLPALTASDADLQELGWRAQHPAGEALQEVIARERARLDPEADPGGQTVVTGAASGLGRALVARLARHRRQLLLVDRDQAGLEQVWAEHPHCRVGVVDLADAAAVAAFVRGADWTAHPVRELFACAGFGLRGPVLAADPAQHARLFQV